MKVEYEIKGSFILAVFFFLIFAYDIENDRDFWTWLWLMSSIIWFYISLKVLIISQNK